MKTAKELLDFIAQLYGPTGPEVECCLKLVTFLSSKPVNQLQHLTFRRLMEVTASDAAALLRILVVASGSKYCFLVEEYEYLDDDGEYLEASASMASLELNQGFVHPRTGKVLESYRDKVFVYYKASNTLSEALQGGGY